jgi:hypothetical protein
MDGQKSEILDGQAQMRASITGSKSELMRYLNLEALIVSMVAVHLWPQSESVVAETRILVLPESYLPGTT